MIAVPKRVHEKDHTVSFIRTLGAVRRQGHILIVDEQEVWRHQLTDLLQQCHYAVSCATTIQEALQLLAERHYHIMILSNAMGSDRKNGMELLRVLARAGLSDPMKVIILSSYGTKEQVCQAFRDYKVADFLSKQKFCKHTFMNRIKDVFSKDVGINLALDIRWQSSHSAEQAVVGMKIEKGRYVEPGTPLQQRLAEELEDLLCRLFAGAESILVRSITAGWSGTRVLEIQPFYTSGSGRAVVVKFGNAQQIQKEYHNYKQYIEPSIVGGLSTIILAMRRTSQLGGIIYAFLGTLHNPLESFGTFYRRASTVQIQHMLNNLFRETCGIWYANTSHVFPLDLTEEYQQLFGLNWEKLRQLIAQRLIGVQGEQELCFQSLNSERTFTNPILVGADQKITCPTYICTTHGDFHQQNLLVDSTGHTWMIDFQKTGQGHILRDLAMLDSVIRFQLLEPEEATLEERFMMEEALCHIESFSQVEQLSERFVSSNPAIMKAYFTVAHLRSLAHRFVQCNPNNDSREYDAALFYSALNALHFSSIALLQCEHALLCASMLADRLRS
jgi:CheY-like chemotaxis protein